MKFIKSIFRGTRSSSRGVLKKYTKNSANPNFCIVSFVFDENDLPTLGTGEMAIPPSETLNAAFDRYVLVG